MLPGTAPPGSRRRERLPLQGARVSQRCRVNRPTCSAAIGRASDAGALIPASSSALKTRAGLMLQSTLGTLSSRRVVLIERQYHKDRAASCRERRCAGVTGAGSCCPELL